MHQGHHLRHCFYYAVASYFENNRIASSVYEETILYDNEDWIRKSPLSRSISFTFNYDFQDSIKKYISLSKESKTNDKESDKSIRKTLSGTFDLYAEVFLSKIPHDTEINKNKHDVLLNLIKEGKKLAVSRYRKTEKLPRENVYGITNKNYVYQIVRFSLQKLGITEYNKTTDTELKFLVDKLEKIEINTIAYIRTSMVRDFLINFVIPSEYIASKEKRILFRNLLSSIRLHFLLQECSFVENLLEAKKDSLAVSYFNSLYNQEHLDLIQHSPSYVDNRSFKLFNKPLFYFYPKFIREIVDVFLRNELNEYILKYSDIEYEVREFFRQSQLVIYKKHF